MMFVSVDQAKQRIRFDAYAGSSEDLELELFIKGASREILAYISPSNPDFLDSSGEPALEDSNGISIVPEDVQDATLLYVAIKYRNRDDDGDVEQEHGFMPRSVLSTLYQYRVPTLG